MTVRPTTDFAKESLFNILVNRFDLEEVTALDLFAGTGNISYELCSRGAERVVAVDIQFKNTRFIQRTAMDMGMPLQVLKSDVFKYLRTTALTFDLIFADPPYDLGNIADIPKLVFENELLAPDGLLIVEHDERTDLSHLKHFEQLRRYGKVNFSFFSLQD